MKKRFLLVGPLVLALGIALAVGGKTFEANADVVTSGPVIFEAAGSMQVLGYVLSAVGAVTTIAMLLILL